MNWTAGDSEAGLHHDVWLIDVCRPRANDGAGERSRGMMKNRRDRCQPGRLLGTTLATVAMVVALAGCSLTPGTTSAPSGQMQREALIGSFIEAVQRNDAAAIAAMTDPLVDPRADISALLDAHGGRSWENVRVAWGPDDFGGQAIYATITATTPDGADSIKILTIWELGRATLALGSAPGVDPGADTRSPTP